MFFFSFFFCFFVNLHLGVVFFVGDSHLILSVVFLNVGLVWWFSLRFNRSPVAFSLNVTLALYSRMSACQSILCTVYLTCSLWLSSGLLMLILNVVWSPLTVDTLLTSYVAALARLVNLRCLFVWVGMNRMLRVSCLRSKFKRKKKNWWCNPSENEWKEFVSMLSYLKSLFILLLKPF